MTFPIYIVRYEIDAFSSQVGLPTWLFLSKYLLKYKDYPTKILHTEAPDFFVMTYKQIFLFDSDFSNGLEPVINALKFGNPWHPGIIEVTRISIPNNEVAQLHDNIFYSLELHKHEYDLDHLHKILKKRPANTKRQSRFKRRTR